jgi:hypothetical protein
MHPTPNRPVSGGDVSEGEIVPKMTLNVSEEFKRALHEEARASGIPVKEVVRRSFAVTQVLRRYDGAQVVIRHDGLEENLIIV